MSWPEFVSTMTGHVAWPVLILVALLVFRKPIAERIRTLRSLNAGAFAAEFGEVEAQVSQALDAEAARPQVPATDSQQGGQRDTRPGGPERRPGIVDGFEQLALVADDNPSYAVVAAWSLLGSVMKNALETVWIDPRNDGRSFPRSSLGVFSTLQRLDLLTPETVRALQSLRRLRNEVAHGAVNPEVGAATAYVQSTQALADAVWRSVELAREARTYQDANETLP